MNEASLAVQVKGVAKRYGPPETGLLAVDHIDFEVQRGEVFGFLGPNGAGKTTTIRMLTGLAQPTAGSARILGLDRARGGTVGAFSSEREARYALWTSLARDAAGTDDRSGAGSQARSALSRRADHGPGRGERAQPAPDDCSFARRGHDRFPDDALSGGG